MYRLATKCATKKRTATWLRIHSNGVSNAASRLVNNERWHCAVRCDRPPRPVRLCRVPTAVHVQREVCGLQICGRRSAVLLLIGFADWQQTDFLFRGRDVAVTMNSVKILHAVRSAITAIAELLVDTFVLIHLWPYLLVSVVCLALSCCYSRLHNCKESDCSISRFSTVVCLRNLFSVQISGFLNVLYISWPVFTTRT